MKIHSTSDIITNSSSEYFIIVTDLSPDIVLWIAKVIWATYGNVEAFNLQANKEGERVLLEEIGYSWEVPEQMYYILQGIFGEGNVIWGESG